MEQQKQVTIFSTSNQLELHRAAGFLENAGIACQIKNLNVQNLFGIGTIGSGASLSAGMFELDVLDNQVDMAIELLEDLLAEDGVDVEEYNDEQSIEESWDESETLSQQDSQFSFENSDSSQSLSFGEHSVELNSTVTGPDIELSDTEVKQKLMTSLVVCLFGGLLGIGAVFAFIQGIRYFSRNKFLGGLNLLASVIMGSSVIFLVFYILNFKSFM